MAKRFRSPADFQIQLSHFMEKKKKDYFEKEKQTKHQLGFRLDMKEKRRCFFIQSFSETHICEHVNKNKQHWMQLVIADEKGVHTHIHTHTDRKRISYCV